ncbi:MAG TPA: CPBP family intramembrane glutamic endopeptidase [Rhabdochlamydiaceae bacterium]|nr:CPBP family intramembrane glutamic endopeptidase [Rhabdochlamydiaceae bacterium]
MALVSSSTNQSAFSNLTPQVLGSKLWSAVHALFEPAIENFRIDRPIKKFYETRDRQDAIAVVREVGLLAIQGYMVAKVGFKTALPNIVITSFFLERIFKFGLSSQTPFDYQAAFPSSHMIQHIGLGLGAGLVICYLNRLFHLKSIQTMQSMGFGWNKQVVIAAMGPSSAMGKLVSLFCCTVIPHLEEVIFRGGLMHKMLEVQKPEKIISFGRICINLSKIEALIKTSLMFGLCHATLGQSWANIPIIAGTSLLGMAWGSLRLMTGNLWAPTVAHMLNNTIVFGMLHDINLPSPTTRLIDVLKDKKSLTALLILA